MTDNRYESGNLWKFAARAPCDLFAQVAWPGDFIHRSAHGDDVSALWIGHWPSRVLLTEHVHALTKSIVMDKNSKVLISGAGVSGLASTLWLSKTGVQPVVVDKAPSLRAGGYLVALSDAAYHFAEELDLIDDLKQGDIGITASSYHNAAGTSLLDLNYSRMFQNIDVIQMMREDFVRILGEKTSDKAEFRFEDQVTAIQHDNGIEQVTFASGREEEFDLVIGCDGPHSGVRNAAFSPDQVNHHYLDLCVAAFRLPNVLGIRSKFETHMEKDRYMAVFTTRDDDLGAVFVWADDRRVLPDRGARKNLLLEAFGNTTDTISKVLDHCPTGDRLYMDVLSQIDMPCWSSGHSVLVGDAAHCLTLFSGRGAGAAFAGSARLCKALMATNIKDAFEMYDQQTRPIISEIQPATRDAVKWYVPRTNGKSAMREMVMRFVPNFVFHKYFQMKYSQV